jgi:DNA gyrase subunit A
VNLLQLEKEEKIEAFVTARDFDQPHFVTMVTKKGTVKKSGLSAFSHPRVNGIIAIKLLEDDRLIDAKITEGDNDIILATSSGYANRFHESDARSMGRNSQGVRGISLRGDDEVVAMVVVKREGTLLAISENGYGKRSEISDYKVTKRGSKGVITLKTTDRNGTLISLLEVVDNDDLMIVTKDGMIIRQAVDKISIIGRNTQGVKLIELNKSDKVYDVARIIAAEESDDEPEEENSSPVESNEKELNVETEEVPTEETKQELENSDEEVIEEVVSEIEDGDSEEVDTETEESAQAEEAKKPEKRGPKSKNEEIVLDFGLDE